MFLFRKNIILVPSDFDGYSLAKGLISFDCYDNKTKCSLHCYNLYFEKPLTMGISIKNKLHKFEVSQKNCKDMQFEIFDVVSNKDEISCVLIDINDASNSQTTPQKNSQDDLYQIVLWGSTQITSGWKTSLDLMLQDEDFVGKTTVKKVCESEEFNSLNVANVENTKNNFDVEQINQSSFDVEQFLKNNENYVKNAEKNGNFSSKVENFCDFSENNNDFSPSEEPYSDEQINEISDKITNMADDFGREVLAVNVDCDDEKPHVEFPKPKDESNQNLTFFDRINSQVDFLFANNKTEAILNEIIPNSKFCKINFDDNSGYYVFGIIYEDLAPKYLCYGIPAKKDAAPPKEMSNLYQWLPIDTNNESGDGFYMMYQDAISGQNISVDII